MFDTLKSEKFNSNKMDINIFMVYTTGNGFINYLSQCQCSQRYIHVYKNKTYDVK